MRMSIVVTMVSAVLLCAADALGAGSADTFVDAAAGFKITKPAGWRFVAPEQVAENRENVRLADKALDRHVKRRARLPLVAIMKHPEGYDDLNPTVQVMLQPMPRGGEKMKPTEVATGLLRVIEKGFLDFSYVEPVRETTVDGICAACVRMKYIVVNAEARRFPALTRMWFVPRGKFLFMISMIGAQEGENQCEVEFQQILDSIRIQR
jgi:hypothetical protein